MTEHIYFRQRALGQEALTQSSVRPPLSSTGYTELSCVAAFCSYT